MHQIAHKRAIGGAHISPNPLIRNALGFHYGVPTWAKLTGVSVTAKVTRIFECNCECPKDLGETGGAFMSDGTVHELPE